MRRATIVGFLLFTACTSPPPPAGTAAEVPGTAEAPSGSARQPAIVAIDSMIPPATAGEDGWNYVRTADADLDGDGEEERVVLTARVEMYRGLPAWDDGQPWQVYVEFRDGRRDYVYAQRLQLGSLDVRITLADPPLRPAVLLIEHLPDRLRILEASYSDTASAPVVSVPFERTLDPRGETAGPRLP